MGLFNGFFFRMCCLCGSVLDKLRQSWIVFDSFVGGLSGLWPFFLGCGFSRGYIWSFNSLCRLSILCLRFHVIYTEHYGEVRDFSAVFITIHERLTRLIPGILSR